MELVVIVPGKLHATIAALGDVVRDAGGGLCERYRAVYRLTACSANSV